ncbi:alpha-amylase family glycosyl hydrolase [Cryomorphaceae bacterium 1068]|nr:alpha-amylase family glycosyl hydrolase [Cryomorphaceae bacterium 1068]
MIKIILILGFTACTSTIGFAYSVESELLQSNKKTEFTLEPPHWWVGMPDENLEILVHKENIGGNEFMLKKSGDGVSLTNTTQLSNPNYIILNLEIGKNAPAQTLQFTSKGEAGKFSFEYELEARQEAKRGLSGKDLIYLVTPDRFANGDESNDSVEGMTQVGIDRSEPYDRHGGDIQGIIDHLDFIQDLGTTAIWPNPLLENDQPHESYHGYAITDHYKIDPRFGTNALFQTLMDSLRGRDMKMVMDVIYNHIGNEHHLYTDIPDSNWFHFHDGFNKTNYRAPALMDPYASDFDRDKMSDGWFDKHMPDLNQKNEHVAAYLIQQTIWWVEEFGIEALRIDTYAYPDQAFMRAWGKAMKEAFPDLFLFAETWVHGIPVQAWFLGDALGPEPNYLDGLTDFQLHYAVNEAMNQGQSWTGGIAKVYYTLAKDYVYGHPENMVTFLDNHDLARFNGVVGKDFKKFKMGIGMLMTMRGIPSLYYGTELLMSETDGHGKIREDVMGGWATDSLDKFKPEGRSDLENEAFDYIKNLAALRQSNEALHSGKTTQYVPIDGLYVYFRYADDQVFMVAVNTSDKEVSTPRTKYDQFLAGKKYVTDAITSEQMPIGEKEMVFQPKSFSIYQLP